MEDKPSQVMRHGKGTSMWSALDSVREWRGDRLRSAAATPAALMALSMIRLRKLPGRQPPRHRDSLGRRAIRSGFNVMLDVGADIRADAEDLLQYALMGAAYARNGLST